MRCLLVTLFSSVLLCGCASTPQAPSGTWSNQAAIDAASEDGTLREALRAYGPNLEWQIDSQRLLARFSTGFKRDEGTLKRDTKGLLRVHFYGDAEESLNLQDDELIQAQSATWPEQRFVRAATPGPLAPVGSSFEHALYSAYLGGTWVINEGLGEGGLVLFQADGSPGPNLARVMARMAAVEIGPYKVDKRIRPCEQESCTRGLFRWGPAMGLSTSSSSTWGPAAAAA